MSSNTPENPYGQPSQAPAPFGQQPSGEKSGAPYTQQAPAPYGQQPGQYGAPAVDPGKTMSIIAIILPFVGFSLVGLILGLVAKSKSKKAGYKNTLALAAIIISAVFIVLSIIGGILISVYFVNLANEVAQACQDGAEFVTINGQQLACPSVTP